jgi:hypothetical protein
MELKKGEIYILPLRNKNGKVGEFPFRVLAVFASPLWEEGGRKEVDSARVPFSYLHGIGYSLRLEGPIAFGTEECSGCFVSTEYLFSEARLPSDRERVDAEFLLEAWRELEQML